MTQPEALQMAKDFDSYAGTLPDRCYFEAATELRRLHTLNESANQDLWEICKHYGPVGELIFYKFKNRSKE